MMGRANNQFYDKIEDYVVHVLFYILLFYTQVSHTIQKTEPPRVDPTSPLVVGFNEVSLSALAGRHTEASP